MRKKDVARSIHQQIGIPETEAAEVLDRILELIKSTLQKGEEIVISGFGKFTVRNKRARRGRNPRTREECVIPAHRVVRFYPSKLFKAAVAALGQESQEP
jgi:integration host factor subunit alpha